MVLKLLKALLQPHSNIQIVFENHAFQIALQKRIHTLWKIWLPSDLSYETAAVNSVFLMKHIYCSQNDSSKCAHCSNKRFLEVQAAALKKSFYCINSIHERAFKYIMSYEIVCFCKKV